MPKSEPGATGICDSWHEPKQTKATYSDFEYDVLISDVQATLHDEGIPLARNAVEQIVTTIRKNRAALDFLARH